MGGGGGGGVRGSYTCCRQHSRKFARKQIDIIMFRKWLSDCPLISKCTYKTVPIKHVKANGPVNCINVVAVTVAV